MIGIDKSGLFGGVAVVTGAAGGIGYALAERFAQAGAHVVLAGRDETSLVEAAERLAAYGTKVLAVPTDVARADQVDRLAERAHEAFGAVDVLCNNAGVGAVGLSWELPVPAWEQVLGVNLWGVVHGLRAFVPRMVERGRGHVVNIASMAGVVAAPGGGPYTASKHAVVGLSETLFHELAAIGSPVGVSVVCPAWVRTGIHRNGVGAGPEEPGSAHPAGRVLLERVHQVLEHSVENGMPPQEVADAVIAAVRDRSFWVFPAPDSAGAAAERFRRAAVGEQPLRGAQADRQEG